MLKIGALWKREKDDGTVYFSGKVDIPVSITLAPGTSLLLFKNRSEHEQSPTLDVFVAEPQKKKNGNTGNEGSLEEF